MKFVDPDECTHYWVIGTPMGRYSNGSCKKCGVSRDDFRNSYDERASQWLHRGPKKTN